MRVALASMVIATLGLPASAVACRCMDLWPSPTEAFARDPDIALLGVIQRPAGHDSDGSERWTVRTVETFRGESSSRLTVWVDGSSCSLRVRPGQQWLIVAQRRGGRFHLRKCSGTRLLAEAGAELDEDARQLIERARRASGR